MANTSTKTKKIRGAAKAATPVKRTRSAGNNKEVPVNKKEGGVNKDKSVSQKLDALMESMAARWRFCLDMWMLLKNRRRMLRCLQ